MKIFKDYEKLIKILVLFVIMGLLSLFIKVYFKPFWSMVVFLFFSMPFYKFVESKKIDRRFSAIISVLIADILLTLFIVFALKYFYSIIIIIVSEAKQILKNGFEGYFDFLEQVKNIKIIDAIKLLQNITIKRSVLYTSDQIVGIFVGNIGTYFLLSYKIQIIDFLQKIIGKNITQNILVQKKNILNMIQTEVKLVIISMFITTIGFLILRIPNSVILGAICGVLDILPFVGTIIVILPMIVYYFFTQKYYIAIGLTCLYILSEILRQILQAKFLSNRLKVSPIIIFFSMYIWIKIFGSIGILFGPLYCIIVKDFILEDNN